MLSAAVAAAGFLRATMGALARRRTGRLRGAALLLARSRRHLLVWAAVMLPLGFIIIRHSTLYDGIRHVLFVIPMLAVIAGAGLLRLRLGRVPLASAAIGGAYVGVSIWTLAVLHPLEYVAVNGLAGGVAGAQGRFDLDYWAVAATVALRRLENRLDYDGPERFAKNPPSITICMGFRESQVAPLFRRPWRLEPDPKQADFIIATERWPCAEDIPDAVLIDEVRRFDRPFAWVYVRPPPQAPGSLQTAVPH
jgi:hypothetical protein